MIESDHRPAIIQIRKTTEFGKKSFCFDHRLTEREGFKEVVMDGWNSHPQGRFVSVSQRIRHCRHAISQWKKSNNTNSAKRIKALTALIDEAHSDPLVSLTEINQLRKDLIQAYRDEETFWRNKSRVQWLNFGDRNTRFFHASTKNRRTRNKIVSIQNHNGQEVFGNKDVATEVLRYYSEIFTSTQPDHIYESLRNLPHVVSEECNAYLTREVTAAEVRASVFSIGPSRAPGLDGSTASFYQTYWDIVGPAVTEEVQHFFTTGEFSTDLNHTNLVLIPKITNPITMKDLRPIALCNVMYKIISKILSLRLKTVLNDVISEHQSGFIPGRHITDNVFLANEVFHSLKTRKRVSEDYMAVKTDVSKAYDRIEWKFLEEVLRKKGFCEHWIMLIMKCVTSTSYSVMINGSPYGYIKGTRGIRQGDPLSPTLFIICADVLSSMMHHAEQDHEIQPLRLSVGGPSLSHLLFADDSLFFIKADNLNSRRLLKVFKDYEQVSGQMINLDNSSITFGSKVYHQTRVLIQQTLAIPNIGGGGKYLGLPEQFGRKKNRDV